MSRRSVQITEARRRRDRRRQSGRERNLAYQTSCACSGTNRRSPGQRM